MDQILYQNVQGRVGERRFFTENFQQPKGFGESSAFMRRIIINGPSIPDKIVNGDYVRIDWGVPPNILTPQSVPSGTGPQVWIETPDGDLLLTWDGTKWVNGSSSISIISGGYRLIHGETTEDFTTFGRCNDFPEGFTFYRFTGPPVYYKIVRFEHQKNIQGQWHHTTIQGELEDLDDPNPRL